MRPHGWKQRERNLPVTTQSSVIGSPSSSSSGSVGVRRNFGASASLSTTSLLTPSSAVRDRDSPRLFRAMQAYWPASVGITSSIRSEPSGSSVIRPSDSERIGLSSSSHTISGRGSPDALQLKTAIQTIYFTEFPVVVVGMRVLIAHSMSGQTSTYDASVSCLGTPEPPVLRLRRDILDLFPETG
uniref:Uncharacterized protein n=1 Tax=Anopheles farauti TaxID=69004 RepID=A0A182R0U4_9DIPT